MNGYIAFTKKELQEQIRTYKWLIMLAVFFLIGMMSPVLAKVMPDMLSGMKINSVTFTVGEVKVSDAYAQFFKNAVQMGIFALLLVFGGTLSNELAKGTLINILSKGLPRYTVLLSKYTAAVVLWTVGYVLSVLTDFGYTLYLFKDATVDNLFFSNFCLWLFGCFVLALIFLSSTLIPGYFGGLVFTFIIIIAMLTVNALPNVLNYNPITLASVNTALIKGEKDAGELIKTVIITGALIILSMTLSISIFQKKKL